MWARKTRGRTAEIERTIERYPEDLIGEEWEGIAALLAKPAKLGGKPEVGLQEVLNAFRYMTFLGGGRVATTSNAAPSTSR